MKSVALIFFALFTLTLQASAPSLHKFYLSNTSLEFNAQNRAIEITSKIFTDDLEHAIEAQCYRYHSLYPQTPEVFELVKKYIGEKLSLQVAGRNVVLNFLGYSVDNDMTTLFIEGGYFEPNQVVVTNTILLEQFADQQNITEVRWNGQSKREYLTKDKTQFQFIP
ncbi:MAG: hypothetical protein NWQ44_02510 [Flavobacteriales bacterium]|jgi:hypothetical protein|nr:hypothetical protein [Flavobacteriales bacterium]MDP4717950.1 hypothetical protein [Flavobacteriales bacterium]MDP4732088.1 hypothetical protein [Flavobacteriales bacterium]MDP4817413.1 hypothetical protein [Flavobacteriales bacterium]MDP4950579.1 hypothetical protein [Flavobacteriales bacterium]